MKSDVDIKHIKTLHEWPLSKVELVEVGGKKYILKTIHEDFVDEVRRQKILSSEIKEIKIPKVYWSKREVGSVSFLMDYVEGKSINISKGTLLDMINIFHSETKNLKDESFHLYNFESFYSDIENVVRYISSDFFDNSKKELREIFAEVFESPYSVVHGDWGEDQIVGKDDNYHIVDFGKSYFGPSILDKTEFLGNETGLNIKAKIVNNIIEIAWYDLCKRKYIDSEYKKQIGEKVDNIKKLIKLLKD